MPARLHKIISGGQTGVDRAALDFALEHGIDHGGWCPAARWSEDGPIPARYLLKETVSADPSVRTEQNVLVSDATLIITRSRELAGGTRLTYDLAQRHRRPVLVLNEEEPLNALTTKLTAFLGSHSVTVLNVAGPRESEAPGLSQFVKKILEASLISAAP